MRDPRHWLSRCGTHHPNVSLRHKRSPLTRRNFVRFRKVRPTLEIRFGVLHGARHHAQEQTLHGTQLFERFIGVVKPRPSGRSTRDARDGVLTFAALTYGAASVTTHDHSLMGKEEDGQHTLVELHDLAGRSQDLVWPQPVELDEFRNWHHPHAVLLVHSSAARPPPRRDHRRPFRGDAPTEPLHSARWRASYCTRMKAGSADRLSVWGETTALARHLFRPPTPLLPTYYLVTVTFEWSSFAHDRHL